jgi:hypothetical protein
MHGHCLTDTQRNWSAVREQMHGYDRSAALPDECQLMYIQGL